MPIIPSPLPDDVEVCGGKIIAEVKAEDENFYGQNCYPTLEVVYHCARCQALLYPTKELGLPNEYTISEWLTKFVEEYEPARE